MSSISISSAANIAPEGWLDGLSDGKATKVIAVTPVVSTIIVFMKNHKLQKDLKSSSLSEEEKTEKLKRACLFTNTANNWGSVQAIISIAASILLLSLAPFSLPLEIVVPAAAFTLGLTVVIGASLIYVNRVNDKVRAEKSETASRSLTISLENILKDNEHYLECDKLLEEAVDPDVASATEAPRRADNFALLNDNNDKYTNQPAQNILDS